MRYGSLLYVPRLWQSLLLAQGQALLQRCSVYSSSFPLSPKKGMTAFFKIEFSQNPCFLEFPSNAHQTFKSSQPLLLGGFLVKYIEDSPHAGNTIAVWSFPHGAL